MAGSFKKKLNPVEADVKNRYWYSIGMQPPSKNSALWLLSNIRTIATQGETAYDFS